MQRPEEETRFPIDVPGYQGSLEELLRKAQRGEVDLSAISVGAITQSYRARMDGIEPTPELVEIADFLTLAARLVALKATAVMPDQAVADDLAEEEDPGTEAGRRLADYRLFRAAAEALLSEASDEGARSFLGLVAPDVIPVERMRIPPERLAAAFRRVLERLADVEPLPVGAVTFSVEDKVTELRHRLAAGSLDFDELFNQVGSRLEAVACFLALLELLRLGEAIVEQRAPFAAITVTSSG
jgi:segregation and condensation protein A